MRNARLLPLALLCACSSQPPPAPDPAPEPVVWTVDRTVVRALREFIYAGYELRIAKDHPQADAPTDLEGRLAATRDDLARTLVEAGADRSLLSDDAGLLQEVGAGVRRSGRYAFVFAEADGDSFSLVRIREQGERRKIVLFDEPFSYELTVLDEGLILDYPSYRAERLGLPSPRQVATYARNGAVRVDRSVAMATGERMFLPQTETLRAAARLARDEGSFLSLVDGPLADMIALSKSALRWRSLEQLWSLLEHRPHADQLERFADDYLARAELRAATELREAQRLLPDPESAPTEEDRAHLFELGSLSAMIHGEPLGQLADILALTALSLRTGAQAAPHKAARRLVFQLVGSLRKGEPSPQADALAFARLSQASPDALRALARLIYRERSRRG